MAGVKNPESVADHCYESAMIAYILSKHIPEKVDIGRVLTMLIFHETGESRLTDMPRRAAPYIKEAKDNAEKNITADIFDNVVDDIDDVLKEFHEKDTTEARLAEASEELQIIFSALMYAKENVGDMSEYRLDVKKYKSYGISIADEIGKIIGKKLDEYLGDKPYWELGYKRKGS
jgi:putative hydrolase of HD superfamily